MNFNKSNVCIVITTYRPDELLWAKCAGLKKQAAEVIVVDNTPGGLSMNRPGFHGSLLSDGVNKGLGKALNVGIEKARLRGYDSIVLLDQDSFVPAGYVQAISSEYEQLCDLTGNEVAAIAPTFIDDQTGQRIESFLRTDDAAPHVSSSCLATSGMFIPMSSFEKVGAFSESYFLDLVDFDWCWRAKRLGMTLYRTRKITLKHRLGLGEKRFAGIKYHVPAEYRHYFQFRDSLYAIFGTVAPMYDRLRLLCLLPLKLVAYPLLLDKGLSRLRWMLMGIRDFFCGVTGIGAAADRLNRC